MTQEKIISLLRIAIELAGDGGPRPFTDEEETAMYNFLDRLEQLGDVLDEDDRPFPKIIQTEQLKHGKGDLKMEEYNRNAKIFISPDKPKEFAIATCISKEDLYDDAYSNGMSEGLKIGRESCSQMVEQFLEETFGDGDLIPPLLMPQLIDKWNKFIKKKL